MKNIKTISVFLLALLFLSPVLGTMLAGAGKGTEAGQYDGLQWTLMVVYNLPFFIASFVASLLGSRFSKSLKEKAAKISYAISIVLSMAGIIFMLAWGLGAF